VPISIISTPDVVGPGASVFVSWGAHSADDYIFVQDINNHIGGLRRAGAADSGFVLLGFNENPPATISTGILGGVYGDAVQLQVERLSSAFVLLDSGTPSSGWTFDPVGFLPNLLNVLYQQSRPVPSGTAFDFSNTALSFAGVATGQGTISHDQALGLVWLVTDFAPGMGREIGRIDRYSDRLIQFVIVQDTGDLTELPAAVLDTHYPSGSYVFQPANPARVDYSVFPACSADLFWIVPTEG